MERAESATRLRRGIVDADRIDKGAKLEELTWRNIELP